MTKKSFSQKKFEKDFLVFSCIKMLTKFLNDFMRFKLFKKASYKSHIILEKFIKILCAFTAFRISIIEEKNLKSQKFITKSSSDSSKQPQIEPYFFPMTNFQ